ncbi:hypothetical protein GCM10023339_33040 [Alloalcanivorax gelatiniphagus]
MLRSVTAVSALATVASLAGCSATGSEAPRPEPKVIEGQATGKTVKGTGYLLTAPKGWAARKVDVPGSHDIDRHVFDLGDRDGFTDNFNVLLAEPGAYDVDNMEAAALNEMGIAGVRNRRARRPVLVAGEPATHVSGRLTKNRVEYVVEQYHAVRDDQVFVVTFSFSPGLGRATRQRTTESVLNT